jgi:hypothetical protein
MVSLVDVGPVREKVQVRGQDIEIRGLSADFLFTLLTKSNELRQLMAQRAIDWEDTMALVNQAPMAIAECIACATGKQGDAETIGFALTELYAGETLEIVTPVFRLTFPKGVKSFVDGLTGLAQEATGRRGWAAATKSPEPSPGASAQAIV